VGARPALGQSALFVGTDMGTVYSINPQTGNINWQRSLVRGYSFNTTPIVAANGYLYIQSDNDVLYCLKQADGADWWVCDCNSFLPSHGRSGNSPRPRKLGLLDYDPNPSITSTGDIIVVGQNALFCVAGYPQSPLDPLAPWPKWQRDLHNTGYAGGGR
jgi:outer membrane protein assembly factor BamB